MITGNSRLILLFLLSLLFHESLAQHYTWGKNFVSSAGYATGSAVAIGINDEVFIAGNFNGALMVGGTVLTSGTDQQDGFITRLDSGGTVQWAKRLGASRAGRIDFMTTAGDGNLIVGASFSGKILLGSDSIDGGTSGSSLIAKYNNAGDLIWYRCYPAVVLTHLILDSHDNIYAATIEGTDPGFSLYRILKCDSSGHQIFNSLVYQQNNTSYISITRLAVDRAEAIYASGLATGNGTVGNIAFQAGTGSFTILKFNKKGNPVWVKNTLDFPAGGLYGSCIMVTDAWANVYYSAFSDKLFLAKYDSAGNALWIIDKQNSSLGPFKFILDERGNLLAAGLVAGNFTLDNITFTNNGFYSTFIGQFDNSGKLSWAIQGKNEELDYIFDLARSRKTGDLYVSGSLESQNAMFGTIPLPGSNSEVSAMALKVSFSTNFIPLSIDLGADTSICKGQSLNKTLPNTFSTYQWQDGSTAATIVITEPGKYYVTATDFSGYQYSDTINVSINPSPTVNLGSDTTLCVGDVLTLSPGPGFSSYQWQDSSSNATFTVTGPGKYSIIVKNQFGCSGQAFINIGYLAPPNVNLGNDRLECSAFSPLDAFNEKAFYAWSTGSTDSVFTPTEAGNYWVTVQNQCGQATDSVRAFSLANVTYPNVITVNNDGTNEKFEIIGIGNNPAGTLKIYNRWGERIFTGNPYKNDWPMNDDLTAEVYYFVLNYPGCEQTYKGWIQVIK